MSAVLVSLGVVGLSAAMSPLVRASDDVSQRTAESAEFVGLVAALRRAGDERQAASAELAGAEQQLAQLDAELAQLATELAPLHAQEAEARERAAALARSAEERERTRWALTFVAGSGVTPLPPEGAQRALQSVAEADASLAVAGAELTLASQIATKEADGIAGGFSAARARRDQLVLARRDAEAWVGRAQQRVARAVDGEIAAAAALRAAEERSGLWTNELVAAGSGIPNRVLDIVRWAEATVRRERPGCGLDWALLAAIGKIESDHGRFGGAALQRDGTVYPAIRGIGLDGFGVAFIADSDKGVYDGDTVLDRAVGPFQFIPTTWAAYGRDGNGDGVADPQNMWDASLAAGNYLCASGGDLTGDLGERRAILAYNQSNQYLADVQRLARWYRNFRPGAGSTAPEVVVAPSTSTTVEQTPTSVAEPPPPLPTVAPPPTIQAPPTTAAPPPPTTQAPPTTAAPPPPTTQAPPTTATTAAPPTTQAATATTTPPAPPTTAAPAQADDDSPPISSAGSAPAPRRSGTASQTPTTRSTS